MSTVEEIIEAVKLLPEADRATVVERLRDLPAANGRPMDKLAPIFGMLSESETDELTRVIQEMHEKIDHE